MSRAPFLKWALVNSLFAVGIITAAALYSGPHIIPEAKASITAVLCVFVLGSYSIARSAWAGKSPAPLYELATLIVIPVGMLGTVSGVLLTFSHLSDSPAARLPGVATAFSSTFIALSCWIVLTILSFLLPKTKSCGCGR